MWSFVKTVTVLLCLGISCAGRAADRPTAVITFTQQGIPHIKADDMFGLGYGAGYASAKTDLCAVADALLTYGGKRSLVHGAEGMAKLYVPRPWEVPNALNDLTIHYSVSTADLAAAKGQLSADVRAALQGYAEGFNRYLHDTPPAARPQACSGAHDIPDISEDDLIRRTFAYAMLLGERLLMPQIYGAAPPEGAAAAGPDDDLPVDMAAQATVHQPLAVGSNAYAIGRALTANGSGLLMANPHYLWLGPERFMQMHLTAPGYDVMGVSMLGTPLIGLGFNASMAWSHTVATGAKATLYGLALAPGDPTAYLMDGSPVAMTRREVTIPVKTPDGGTASLSHTFWETEFGPIVEGHGLPWSREKAYALMDPNKDNIGLFEQMLGLGRAKTVAEVGEALSRHMGAPFLNTIAGVAAGDALYAKLGVTPGVPRAELEAGGG
jgi:acyl-homoserine-lactone acylase